MNKKGLEMDVLLQIILWTVIFGLALAGLYMLVKSATGA